MGTGINCDVDAHTNDGVPKGDSTASGDSAASDPAGVVAARERPNEMPPALSSLSNHSSQTDDTLALRPPLPARSTNLSLLHGSGTELAASISTPVRPRVQAVATSATTQAGSSNGAFFEGKGEAGHLSPPEKLSSKGSPAWGSLRRLRNLGLEEAAETASIKSFATVPTPNEDGESIFGDTILNDQRDSAWERFNDQFGSSCSVDKVELEAFFTEAEFREEFKSIATDGQSPLSEDQALLRWKAKKKHFLILSSAGKPIYSRHGNDTIISSSIGVLQTIISYYQSSGDQLTGFTADNCRFVVICHGPLYLVGISQIGETDAQLRTQLEALYMQILSTLTLPNLNHIFANRPSSDLKQPLKGTEVLLSALADSFTRGSPSTLLSSVECLRLRKSQRQLISEGLLRHRSESLLYGLLITGGRLISVIRPRKHSLHPSDLQLIFNMLFESGGIMSGGGENWIPLCLPGFNQNGYLYMYVGFLGNSPAEDNASEHKVSPTDSPDPPTVLLISADKESFHKMRRMRNNIVDALRKDGSLGIINAAVKQGRLSMSVIAPGSVIRHFLYKSKGNVQYVMPSLEPYYDTPFAKRELLSLYHSLHGSVHAKNSHLKVQHRISLNSTSLAWTTSLFEFYCVASPNTSRNALAQSANKIIQWVRREEERVFIIGGAVF